MYYMHPKKHKKKCTFLYLNRVRIFTEFEHAQLSYVQTFTNHMSFSVAGFMFFTSQDLRGGKSSHFANFFFAPAVLSPSLRIAVFPNAKNFKILGRSSAYQNLLRFSLTKSCKLRFKPNLLKQYGGVVSVKKARYLGFFEYGSALFEQKNFSLSWAWYSTFLNFESWYGYKSVIGAKYAKIAGWFILYPYWVDTALLSWTWLLWLGYQEVTLFTISPARALGNFQVRRAEPQGFNRALSRGANLRVISAEVSSAALNFYLFVLLFLCMLEARQISFIKLLETLREGGPRRTFGNLGWDNFRVLVPKTLKTRATPAFVFFTTSWSTLFTYIFENVKRFVLAKLVLTQSYHFSLIQLRLSLDIAGFLAKFELSNLGAKRVVSSVSPLKLTILRGPYEGFFTFNNLFRPRFLSICLVLQIFNRVLVSAVNGTYALIFYKLVFFSIKQMFSFFFFFFFKKRLFFSKYFVISLLYQTFYLKIRVIFLFLSMLLNFIAGVVSPRSMQSLFFFMQLGFVAIFCCLAWNVLGCVILLSTILFVCVNFSKLTRIENIDFFGLFGIDFLFSGKAFTRRFYYAPILFTIIFDALWVSLMLLGLIRVVLPYVQVYFKEVWRRLNFLINFWLPNIFSVFMEKRYSGIYRSSVTIGALLWQQFFDIFGINLRLADYWYLCSVISGREFTWLLLGFVQIFWAQLAWWRDSTQNVMLWRQIFGVNKILFAAGVIQRGPVLNRKLIYINIFDHLATFLTIRHFLFWSSKLASRVTESFSLYFSFLSSTKINLLRLNWYANLRLLRVRRSEVRTQAKILTQNIWRIRRSLRAITVWVCTRLWGGLGFIFYRIQCGVFSLFLIVRIIFIVLFLLFLVANTSFVLLFYFSVKLFLLMFILSNFKL